MNELREKHSILINNKHSKKDYKKEIQIDKSLLVLLIKETKT